MAASKPIAPPPQVGSAAEVVTGIYREKSSFKWKIEDFDVVYKSERLVRKQRFQFEAGNTIGVPTTWECFLESAIRRDGQKWIGIFIILVGDPGNVQELNASSMFQIMRPDGSIYFTGRALFANMVESNTRKGGWGFRYIIAYDTPVEALPLFDRSLIIEVDFVLYGIKCPQDKIKMDVPSQVKEFEIKSVFQLSEDFEKKKILAGGNANAITKIVTMDNVEIPVNRGVLAARSPVFQAMFQSQMKESQTGKVILNDLSSKTVKVLVHYINTGRLTKNWKSDDVIEELTIAAHRYELKLLTAFLDRILGKVCTFGNAKRMALLAQKLGMKKAEMELFHFIRNNARSLEDLVLMDATS